MKLSEVIIPFGDCFIRVYIANNTTGINTSSYMLDSKNLTGLVIDFDWIWQEKVIIKHLRIPHCHIAS